MSFLFIVTRHIVSIISNYAQNKLFRITKSVVKLIIWTKRHIILYFMYIVHIDVWTF